MAGHKRCNQGNYRHLAALIAQLMLLAASVILLVSQIKIFAPVFFKHLENRSANTCFQYTHSLILRGEIKSLFQPYNKNNSDNKQQNIHEYS